MSAEARRLIEAAFEGEAAVARWQRLPENAPAAYARWVGTRLDGCGAR